MAAVVAVVAEVQANAVEHGKYSMKGLENEGCALLAPALATNTALKQADLSCNSIGPEGCRALAPALKSNNQVSGTPPARQRRVSVIDTSARALGLLACGAGRLA